MVEDCVLLPLSVNAPNLKASTIPAPAPIPPTHDGERLSGVEGVGFLDLGLQSDGYDGRKIIRFTVSNARKFHIAETRHDNGEGEQQGFPVFEQ